MISLPPKRKNMPASVWQGKLVRLRAVEPDDWQHFEAWSADSDSDRNTYFISFPHSREAMKKFAMSLATTEPKNHEFSWMIENLEGQTVGMINTHNCDARVGTFRYGLVIQRQFWRKGYASDAIRLVLRFFFDELRYQKVNAEVYSYNEPSYKLHQKLGFKEEGRLRRMVYTDGCFYDEIIFGMTCEEFQETLKQG